MPWVILRGGDRLRWGGDLRKRYLFAALEERTGAQVVDDWSIERMRQHLDEARGRRWQVWRSRARVASVELLGGNRLQPIRSLGIPQVLDVHDHPNLQSAALGVEVAPGLAAEREDLIATNVAAFHWLTAPSTAFAQLAGLPMDRVLVAGNGTDTTRIRVEPWPDTPAVGFISGAAPRRGIEELVEAVRIVRRTAPTTRLLLWLAATGDASAAYLERLAAAIAGDPWIEIAQVPYERLSAEFGRATVLCIPTPAHSYWDSVPPVKLFDGLASGRPTVTTPRIETAALIRRHEAGLVAADDSAQALAVPIERLIHEADVARRLGANARAAAEREHDWRVIGDRLARLLVDERRA